MILFYWTTESFGVVVCQQNVQKIISVNKLCLHVGFNKVPVLLQQLTVRPHDGLETLHDIFLPEFLGKVTPLISMSAWDFIYLPDLPLEDVSSEQVIKKVLLLQLPQQELLEGADQSHTVLSLHC